MQFSRFSEDIEKLNQTRSILNNFYEHEMSIAFKKDPTLVAKVDSVSLHLEKTLAFGNQLMKNGNKSVDAMKNWNNVLHDFYKTTCSVYFLKH